MRFSGSSSDCWIFSQWPARTRLGSEERRTLRTFSSSPTSRTAHLPSKRSMTADSAGWVGTVAPADFGLRVLDFGFPSVDWPGSVVEAAVVALLVGEAGVGMDAVVGGVGAGALSAEREAGAEGASRSDHHSRSGLESGSKRRSLSWSMEGSYLVVVIL